MNPAPSASLDGALKPYSPDIEQQINLLDRYYTTTSATFVPTAYSLGMVFWDSSRYTGETVYFEAVIADSGGTNALVHAALYDNTNTEVNGSDVSTSYDNYIRLRSPAISLEDGKFYTVRLHHNGSNTARMKAARLIIVQSHATKLTDTDTWIDIGSNQTGITNTAAAELTNPKYYMYDQAKFNPTVEST